MANKDTQKGVEKIIKDAGGRKVGNKKYDMTEAVKKEGDKGKDKSK